MTDTDPRANLVPAWDLDRDDVILTHRAGADMQPAIVTGITGRRAAPYEGLVTVNVRFADGWTDQRLWAADTILERGVMPAAVLSPRAAQAEDLLLGDPDRGFVAGDRICVSRPTDHGFDDIRIGHVYRLPGHSHLKMQGKCVHEYAAEGWTIAQVTS